MPNEIRRLKSIPLWTERWDRAALEQRRRLAPRAFERGFFGRAYSDQDVTFPSFSRCEKAGIVLGQIQRAGWPCYTGVDLSSKKRPGNAIVTVAIEPQSNRRFPVDVRFGAWRSKGVADQLEDVNRAFNPIVFMVENNGYQEALIDWIADCKGRYHFWQKVEPTTTTGGNKSDAELGLPGLEVEFSNEAWTFPLSEYETINPDEELEENPTEILGSEAWRRLANEFRDHPFFSTSDGVMATWFARQGIELYRGFGGGAGEIGDLTAR